jgi:hypothetical protein
MATLTPVPLVDPSAATPPVPPIAQEGGAARFQAQLTQAEGAQQAPPAADAADSPEAVRARRSLDLDAQNANPATGDAILNGLQKLRGAFDGGLARVNEAIAAPTIDVQTLLAVQMEMVNYSLLVDTTSKLTGKSTQSFDSLMKGQ